MTLPSTSTERLQAAAAVMHFHAWVRIWSQGMLGSADEAIFCGLMKNWLRSYGVVEVTHWRDHADGVSASVRNSYGHKFDHESLAMTESRALADLVIHVAEIQGIKP